MFSIIQVVMVVGGVFLLLGSHLFFKNNPQEEAMVDEVVEQVVKTTTSFDLDEADKVMDALVDIVEKKDNK